MGKQHAKDPQNGGSRFEAGPRRDLWKGCGERRGKSLIGNVNVCALWGRKWSKEVKVQSLN
jgi:hypothetical protein